MTPIHIYLADDDSDDKELFIDALAEIPVPTETVEFENGIDLMANLFSDQPQPDAIYLDLHMPLMDGFECLEDIRSIPEFSGIHIIMYSTSHHEKDIEALKISGADQYVRKPSSFNQLKTLLYQSLKLVGDRSSEKNGEREFVVLV